MQPSSSPRFPTGNGLLDALPTETRDRLRDHFEPVELPFNQPVHAPGQTVEYVFFPTEGLISIVAKMRDGASVEIGMVGKEGIFGVPVILGDDTPSYTAMVQIPGNALRMRSSVLRREAQANAALNALLLRYVQMTLTVAAQSAACNRLHLLEQRCARWLLAAHDRVQNDTFPITHEFLAMMLGVRRAGVTVAAQALQEAGLITYNHGSMTILDRAGLEAAACECYGFIKGEADRLLGGGSRA